MSDADYSEEADFADKDRILADISHWLEVILGHPEHVRALEIGGAGGMLAGMFANKYGHVVCTDVVDWNSQYGGEFLKLVSENLYVTGDSSTLLDSKCWLLTLKIFVFATIILTLCSRLTRSSTSLIRLPR